MAGRYEVRAIGTDIVREAADISMANEIVCALQGTPGVTRFVVYDTEIGREIVAPVARPLPRQSFN